MATKRKKATTIRRGSKHQLDIIKYICLNVSRGASVTKLLKDMQASDPTYPTYFTFNSWLKENPYFAEMYGYARQEQLQVHLDEHLPEIHRITLDAENHLISPQVARIKLTAQQMKIEHIKWEATKALHLWHTQHYVHEDKRLEMQIRTHKIDCELKNRKLEMLQDVDTPPEIKEIILRTISCKDDQEN